VCVARTMKCLHAHFKKNKRKRKTLVMNYLTFSLCFEHALDLLVKFGTLGIVLYLILARL